jgi:hypothetical protein
MAATSEKTDERTPHKSSNRDRKRAWHDLYQEFGWPSRLYSLPNCKTSAPK